MPASGFDDEGRQPWRVRLLASRGEGDGPDRGGLALRMADPRVIPLQMPDAGLRLGILSRAKT